MFTENYIFHFLLLEAIAHHQFFAASRVFVETFATLYAQETCLHHVGKQGSGSVFLCAEAHVQHVHDVVAGVQAYEICQLQRPHWVRHATLHNGVDFLNAGHAALQRLDCLVNHRQQDAVADETRDNRLLRKEPCQ